MKAAVTELENERAIRAKAQKSLMYVAIVSMVMLFAALTSVYIIRQSDSGRWISFEIPQAFYISTVLIILSSGSLVGAVIAAKRDAYKFIQMGLGATILLGCAFMYSQFQAWDQIHAQELFFADKTNASGSFLYTITGMHLFHLLGGLIALSIIFVLSLLKRYSSTRMTGLEVISVYWHFLGVLWLYLLLFLVNIR